MTLEQASVWLVGSILFILGSIVLFLGLVLMNNILYKHWKPVTIFSKDSWSLFSGHSTNDPMQNLTQAEYDSLVEHLENFRSKNKLSESILEENRGKK